MRKKYAFWAIALCCVCLISACEMPSAVKIQTEKFEIGIPIKYGNFNVTALLSEALKDSFPEDFEIYDMVNYKNAQAFLIGYQMDLLDSFNPDDYLDDIQGQMDTLGNLNSDGIDPIYPEPIKIPKMTTEQISDTWFYFEMSNFFQNMEDQINTTSTPKTTAPLAYPQAVPSVTVDLPAELKNLPSFMVFREGSGGEANFDSAFVHTGGIVLDIWLEDISDPNLVIRLNDIEMKGENNPSYMGNPKGPQDALLHSGNNFKDQIIINLADEEVIKDNPPKFSIGSIVSDYNGTPPGMVGFKLVMQPQIRGITLRGARGLKIGEMDQPLPDEIVDEIRMEPVDDLLNAQIEQGAFRISSTFPEYVESENRTGCKGLSIGYELYIEQDPVIFEGDSFQGLADTFTDRNYSLIGKHISGKNLSVNPARSKLIIKAGPEGATFKLFDDVGFDGHLLLTEKVLPIKMDMGINIEKLEVVRWKMKNDQTGESIIPAIDIPPIDFSNVGNKDISFVKNITFEQVTLDLDFTVPNPPPVPPTANHGILRPGPGLPESLEGRLALMINCRDLGFNDTTNILHPGSNVFASEPTVLTIHDGASGGAGLVMFDVALIPVIDGVPQKNAHYMEFGPIVMGNDDIKMDIYAESSTAFTWTEAEIDLKAALDASGTDTGTFEGIYPKTDKKPVDMSKAGKYLHGISLNEHVTARMFLKGPRQLIEIMNPSLEFSAEWENGNSELLFDDLLAGYNTDVLPKISDFLEENAIGDFVYPGTGLPDEGLAITGSLSSVLKDFPEALRFSYKMKLPTEPITVYPDTFDNVDSGEGGIRALILLMMPLELEASKGAYFSIPDDVLGKSGSSKDIFDRKSTDGIHPDESSPFTDASINSLGIRIDFEQPIFSGAYLHLDKDRVLFGENGLRIGQGRNLKITINNKQRKIIDEYMIYPDIRFVFPEATTIAIPRKFVPVKITIAASGSYTLDLDDLGLGN